MIDMLKIKFEGKIWEFDKRVTLDVYRNGDEKIYVDKEHKVAYRGVRRNGHEESTKTD
jgi:hypothetical protein